MIPQQFAFAAGNLPDVIFDPRTTSPESEQIVRMNRKFALETMSVLKPHQRAELRFYQRPADVQLDQANQVLAPCWPLGELVQLPHILGPEVHHELRSKKGLARSWLPMPGFEVIEVRLPAEPQCPTSAN